MTAIPPQPGPHYHRSNEHGQTVNLAFHSRKPSRVAKQVAQRPDQRTDPYTLRTRFEQEHRPVKKHNRQATRHSRECVDAGSHQQRIAERKPGKDMSKELVERGTRRMSHLQEVGHRDELATVPKTDGGFERKKVNRGGGCGQQPADHQFTTDLLKMSSHSSLTISSVSPCSTEEKSREAA